jgi:hypothetical protein
MKTRTDHYSTREERRAAGRACRDKVSRLSQAHFDPKARKFDPIELMKSAHKGRIPELIPLKFARMAATQVTFYRGREAHGRQPDPGGARSQEFGAPV